jgi:hypothetical protein
MSYVHYDLTPTKFFDPDASGTSDGSGTITNPFYTNAQINTWIASLTGAMAGQVLGFKRGATFRGSIKAVAATDYVYGTTASPFFVVPYGDALAAPIITNTVLYTDWALYPGYSNIWVKSGFAYDPSIFDTGNWDRNWRVTGATLADKLAALVTAGAGFGFYDSGSYYLIPLSGNPNDGCHEVMSNDTYAFALTLKGVADTGFVVISGLDVRGGLGFGISVQTAASATAPSFVHIVGNKCAFNGENKAGSSLGRNGIYLKGLSDAVRISNGLIAGNLVEFSENNVAEVQETDGLIIEHNRGYNCHNGNAIAELWQSNSTAKIRYNIGTGRYGKPGDLENSNGVWVNSRGSGGATLPASNTGNEVYYNLMYDMVGPLQNGGENTLFYHNTCVGIESLATGANTPNVCETAGASWNVRNNLFISALTHASAYCFRTNTATLTASAANHFMRDSFRNYDAGTAYTSLATWNAQLFQGGVDSQSSVYASRAAVMDTDYKPVASSVLLNAGEVIAGYQTRDLEGKAIAGAPTIGCYQLLPAIPSVTI